MAKRKQIAALKYFLFRSTEFGDLCKRVLATLFDESRGLTRPVQICLEANMQGYDRKELQQLCYDFSVATSSNCNTHLQALLHLSGSKLQFGYSQRGTGCMCGLWLKNDEKDPKLIPVIRAELEKIDLLKPGLYPSSEKQELERAS